MLDFLKITLRVGDDEVIFDVDQSIKIPSNEDDECYGIDDLDNTINAEAQELLVNDEPKREHLYSASANEIKEKKPKLKDLPHHLEYAYLHGDKSFPIIISSELSNKEKSSLLQVLEKRKGAIAWKMSDIKGISPSYCTHKIQMEDDFKSIVQGMNITAFLMDFHDPSKFQSHPKIKKRQHSHVLMGLLITKEGCLLGYDNAPASFQDACRQFFNDWWKTLLEVFLDGTLRISALSVLKEKLTTAPIIISPDWNVPFELMCDASDFVVGAVLGQRIDGKCKPIYYASKTLNNAQEHYTTTEKELLAVVFSFDKFWFDIEIKDKRGAENLAVVHLSRLENPDLGTFTEEEIVDEFPDEHLMVLKIELNNDEPWGHHSASVTGRKVYESRFFWPTIFKDAKDYVIKCDACQRSGNISSRSEIPQNNIQVEAQALPTNDARVVIKFLRRLFARFGVPKALITYHPQTNGQTKVTNRAIKRILERSVGYNLKNWSERLDDALWVFKAAYKTPTGCTPFRLVYGKSCHLPVEIEHKAYWVLKQCNMDLIAIAKNHFIELNELMKLEDGAYKNTRI
ncbi:reverse transcriptase domain-containing protein [Tanacetum coccineum]